MRSPTTSKLSIRSFIGLNRSVISSMIDIFRHYPFTSLTKNRFSLFLFHVQSCIYVLTFFLVFFFFVGKNIDVTLK